MEKLHSPEQLPDIEGDALVFVWDQEDADSIITYGDKVIWREETGWEVYDRFEEIAVILQRKYGARLKDLVPTMGSLYALYGDTSRAYGHVEHARAQIAKGSIRTYTFGELIQAIKGMDDGTISLHLLAGGNPDLADSTTRATLLHVAAQERQPAIAWLLIQAGANVNALDRNERSPLVEALDEPPRRGYPGVVAGNFVMPADQSQPPYRAAHSLHITKLLVEAGASLDGLGKPMYELTGWPARMYRTPLALAAQNAHLDAVRYLLEQGAPVDGLDCGGMTPLHRAVNAGHVEVAKILIAAGADVNLPYPPFNPPPLLRAILAPDQREHATTIRLLVDAGANLEQTDTDGMSPLFAAINEGRDDLLKLLLELGANVHHRNEAGFGALAFLVQKTYGRQLPQPQMIPLVETLRTAGADPAARNKVGKTARDLAQEFGMNELESLL